MLSDGGATGVTTLDPSSWRVAREVLTSGGRIDIEGASGSFDCDSRPGEVSGEAWVSVVDLIGGQWTFVPHVEPTAP